MDLFPAGSFVRLRSHARGKYVHADKDGVHVSLRSLGVVPSLNAVWKVDLWPVEGEGGDNLLLLQGAAYGRYLAVAHPGEVVASGYHGVRAIQLDNDLPFQYPPITWTVVRVEAGQNYVRLHSNDHRLHNTDELCLRVNGSRRSWRKKNRVTVAARNGDETTMMQWTVEAIPSTPVPLPLPPPPPRRLLLRWFTGHPGRRIWYFRLNNDGNPVNDDWPEFFSNDNSVSNLRTEVARLERDQNITLGVRAGYNARVIPLVTNLPKNEDPMQIVVYTTGSPAAAALSYPQF